MYLTLCCCWLICPIQKYAKNLKNVWNHGLWVLIWEYSVRAIQWVATWQGSVVFQKSLRHCALDISCFSIGRVKAEMARSLLLSHEPVINWRFQDEGIYITSSEGCSQWETATYKTGKKLPPLSDEGPELKLTNGNQFLILPTNYQSKA